MALSRGVLTPVQLPLLGPRLCVCAWWSPRAWAEGDRGDSSNEDFVEEEDEEDIDDDLAVPLFDFLLERWERRERDRAVMGDLNEEDTKDREEVG